MKQQKRGVRAIISLLLAMMLTMALGATALAEESNHTLTLNGTKEGHTYEVYQIFKGDLSDKDGGKILSNIAWGEGITYTGDLASAEAVAEALSSNSLTLDKLLSQLTLTNPVQKVQSTSGTTQITNLPSGYYLVKDQDNSVPTNDAYTENIVQIVGDTDVKIKSDIPTVVKKVKDNNPTTDWQDSADYSIGENIPYQITGTVANNVASYKTYKYIFTDTMSKGLTYAPNTAKITIGETDVTRFFTETITPSGEGNVVTWSIDNLKGIEGVTIQADTKVVVTYSAQLNQDAVIGSTGNPNTVKLTFSNNPNLGGEGKTGETPEDKNIVFTYKVIVNKTDGKAPLTGAGFTLYKKTATGEFTPVGSEMTGEQMTQFTWSGLGDGEYKLSETTTPKGYNTIKDMEFTITAEHVKEADSPTLSSLTGDGTIQFTPDKAAGSLTAEVINKAGIVLPSTGGAGTTLIYILGAVLVLGSGLVLVMKRKSK